MRSAVVPGFNFPFFSWSSVSKSKANFKPFLDAIPPLSNMFDAILDMNSAESNPAFLLTNVSGYKDNNFK